MKHCHSSITRRQFGACLGALPFALQLHGATADMPWAAPARIKKVFVGDPKGTWPHPDLNFEEEIAGIDARLNELEQKHRDLVQFVASDVVRSAAEAEAWARKAGDADAALVLDLTAGTGGIMRPFADLDTPLLLFTRPITGWAYMDFARWIQQGKKADMVASSDFADLEPLLPLLKTIHHMRNSKVLIVRADAAGAQASAAEFSKHLGFATGFPSYQALRSIYDQIDARQAAKEADEFSGGALRVIEPSREDILKSLRFYLAVRKLLEQEKANAITIDCLGGFRRGDLPAYPCVAWTKLNDEGLYGVCEADLASTLTQMLVTSFTGKPGFVSDPTFDTSRNEVIHAHCVSATRLMGIGGKASPYILRTHMEDEKGVSVQVRMPERETVTVAQFNGPRKFLVSTGETTTNIDGKRGCRSKIITRVADARKMVEGYTGGLHRVLFYGDYVEPLQRLGRLMGIQVVKEG